MRRVSTSLITPALVLLSHAVAGQEPTSGAAGVLEIEVRAIATIGTDGAGPALSRLTSLAMDDAGCFYAAPTYEPGVAAVYGRDGRYLRSFGRRGQGPGEYTSRLMRVRIAPQDTVHVLDGPRHTVLAPGGDTFVRLTTLSFVPRSTSFTRDGRLVVTSPLEGSGRQVHILSPDGTVERSLVPVPEGDPRALHNGVGPLSNIKEGNLWIGSPDRYRLDLWSTDGRLLRSIEREVPWFPPRAARGRTPEPGARLLGLLQTDSLVWTLVRVPDSRGGGFAPTGRPVEEVDMNEHEDTIIEALFAVTGEVVGSIRLDAAASGFLGKSPIVYTSREMDSGLIAIDVLRLSLGQ